ncbi:MAG: flagellar motor switch protein FliN [Candidatus Aureabacteria bacterium]|nr:flagellar motor switch protein FliN [Candidatus Auribacterota bacterium]
MPEKEPNDQKKESENELEENLTGRPVKFTPIQEGSAKENTQNLDLILDINVEVTVELGRANMMIKDVLELAPGSVIELNKLAGEPVDVFVNKAMVARGEVVVINENFGVRITEILGAAARIQHLGGSAKSA